MNQEKQRELQMFVQQSRAQGMPDTAIVKYMAERGWLQEAMPQQFGAVQQAQNRFNPQAETQAFQSTGQEEKKPGFFQRVGERIGERGANFAGSMERQQAGQQTPMESGFQLAGQTIGAGFDIAFEGVKSILGLAPETLKNAVGEAGQKFLETAPAQAGLNALAQGVEVYQGWKEENPRDAANLEALGNIVSVVPLSRGGQAGVSLASKTGQPIARTGAQMTEKAGVQQAAKLTNDLAELISPPISGSKLPAGKKLTDIQEGGVFATRKFSTESPFDQDVLRTVSQIPGIEKGNILQKGQTMERYIASEAENLVRLSKDRDVIFPKQELISRLKTVQTELAKTPLLTGDAGKSANRVLAKYVDEISKADGKLSEVLRVRKEMDKWIENFAGKKALSGEKANAMTIAVKELRDATNDFLITKSPVGSQIQESLKRQSNTFRALDNVTPKAIKEAGSSVERFSQTLQSKMKTRTQVLGALALLTATGTFQAMSIFAPVATGILGASALAGAYKMAVSPAVRLKIGKQLKGVGKLIDELPKTDRSSFIEGLETLAAMGIISTKELPSQ
jgi:hypothetical protein